MFSQQTQVFLSNLRENNNRPWFQEHKQEYLDLVQLPTRQLAEALKRDMEDFDPFIQTDPKRVTSRIYRDTRFSKNKTPYKICSYLIYRRPTEDKQGVPCWFFEINPEGYCYGMGAYNTNPKVQANFRILIDENPEEFLSVINNINSRRFKLYSESYKRLLPNPHSMKIQPYYQSKGFYLMCDKKTDKVLFSNKLAPTMIDGFMQLKLLYDFLWKAKARSESNL